MAAFYASPEGTQVCRLTNVPAPPEGFEYNTTPTEQRGWCTFEYYVTMITVGTDAYRGGAAALTSPKLLDVQGNAVPELQAAPTPEEFEEKLKTTRFVGKGDHEKVLQMYQEFWLANGVGGRARLALREQRAAGEKRHRQLRRRVLVGMRLA